MGQKRSHKEIRKDLKTRENKNTAQQNMEYSESVSEREVQSYKCFHQKRSHIHNPTLHLKEREKEEQTNPEPAERRT